MATFLLHATERYGVPILAPLAATLRRSGHTPAWFIDNRDAVRLPTGEHRLASPAEVTRFAPRAVFSAANVVPHFFPGAKVQVFHGFNAEKRPADRGHFRIRGLFDLYCTQGPSTTLPFRELAARHRHFTVVETGWPKLDPLFAEPSPLPALHLPDDPRPVVMYAATFTPSLSSAPWLYDELARLIARGDRYWLLTLHPKCDPALIARYRTLAGPHARFVEAEDLVAAERAADVLVSDTSSVIAEFVVQHKPVVTFRNRQPQPYMLDIATPAALDAALARARAADGHLRAALAASAELIHPWRDGRSSERVVAATEALLGGRLGRLAPKPGNWWRKLQLRWRLGYLGR